MYSSKVLIIVCLLSLVLVSNSKVVYRKFERKNPKKNYVEVIEVFDTIQKPPKYLETEKDLNDFLGRDSFKSSMNFKEETAQIPDEFPIEEDSIVTTRRPSTGTTMTPATATQTVQDRKTKPTIKPNPFENINPDYTSLYRFPSPDIQVTKHLPNTILNTPQTLITIKETDDHPGTSRNTLSNEENNYDAEYTDDTKNNNNEDTDDVVYDDDQTNQTEPTYEDNDVEKDDDENDDYLDSRKKRFFHSKALKLKHTTKQ
ncbi:unnamed protein product [Diamesa tonsa]